MTITVSSGVTSSGLTISSGDPLVVLSGGAIDNITVLSGGLETLSSGAIADDGITSSGGISPVWRFVDGASGGPRCARASPFFPTWAVSRLIFARTAPTRSAS